MDLLPVTPDKVRIIGASLKKGKYISASSYLSANRVEAEREGYEISGPVERALKDYRRAAERGLGGPVKSRALPFESLYKLSGSRKPWVKGGLFVPGTP